MDLMSKLPINPSMLKWAINDAALTVESVAEATGRDERRVTQWIEGGEKPYKGDVEKIAARTGRSVSFFFLKSPPESKGPDVKFRKAVSGGSQDASTELRALRQANRYQKLLNWAADEEPDNDVDSEEETEPSSAPKMLALPKPEGSPEEYADEVRTFLGWSTAEQRKFSSKSALYKDLRSRIESAGIAVVFLDAGENNCRGFSLPDDRSPLIVLNSKYRLASLKSFTLLHEFAHIAHGESAVCHDRNAKEEKWCDAFAAAFLLPKTSLIDYLNFKGWSSVSVDQIDERVRLISQRYHASWQSVAIRLNRLGFANQAVVDETFTNSREVVKGFSKDGGPRVPEIRFDEHGKNLTTAIFELREENKLSELDARQILRVDGQQMKTLRSLSFGAA